MDGVVDVDVAALVDQARAGDDGAWAVLYRRVYPRLFAYAARRLDRERAREAVSETMVRAVGAIGRFTWQGAGFDAWLFGILRHVVLDAQRVGGRRGDVAFDPVDHAASPLDHVLHTEEAAALRAAFAQLSPVDRELLELRVVAGLSAEDTAAVLGKRPGAVRMAQSRALTRLRALMDGSA